MSDDYPVYGPQVKRPMRVSVLRVASVVLALSGLVLLYLYSINRDIPTVQISAIKPTMNFAYVRIVGEVTRDAYVFESGGLIFNLNDGSGEVAVMGSRKQAEALQREGRLPRRGDHVDVAGSLSVSADQEIKLRMQSAEQMLLRRKKSVSTAAIKQVLLSDISADQAGERLTVSGKLKEIEIPGPGSKAPYKLIIEQGGATLELIFWDEVFQGLEQKLPMPGKIIQATGRVEEYKGLVQLKIWEAEDLTERSAADTPKVDVLTSIREIRAEQEGQVFTIRGTLGEPRSIRGGVIYPISDDSGEMVVLFWDKQVSGEERDALEEGVRLKVTAPLVVYKDVLELVPEDVGGFVVEEDSL